jgi:hypothetical protein
MVFQYKRRCFHCNAPRPIDAKSGNVEAEAEAAGPRGTEGLRPLLVEFVEQRGEGRGAVTADAAVLGALVDCFGLHGDAEAAAAAGVCRFPLEALRLLRRPQQRVLVGVRHRRSTVPVSPPRPAPCSRSPLNHHPIHPIHPIHPTKTSAQSRSGAGIRRAREARHLGRVGGCLGLRAVPGFAADGGGAARPPPGGRGAHPSAAAVAGVRRRGGGAGALCDAAGAAPR